MTEEKKPLGRILLQQRALTQPELDDALTRGGAGTAPLASRLIQEGKLSEIQALKALSEQSGVPGIDLNQICVRLSDLSILPRELAARHKLLPVLVREDRIFVAMAAPTDKKVVDELEFVTGKRVFPYIALSGPLIRAISAAYDLRDRGESYYVGPACPPEVLKKAGIASTATPARGIGAVPEEAPPPPSFRAVAASAPAVEGAPAAPQAASPVVVDDAMKKMAGADELNDADFGDVDRDLSTVAELPVGAVPVPPAREGQRTLLVVDDEAEIRRMLKRVFEERGYRIIEADRGLVALRMVKEHLPDLIILDAMLPEVHGFDIARRIKGTQRYGHIPIVMVSAVYRGWRFAEDVKGSYGVEAYLEKPFRVADVVAAVESALAQNAPSRNDPERMSGDAERLLASGIAAYQAGDMEKATADLLEGTRVDPLAYRLHFHLGLLYGKKGQVYDAIQELEIALDINGKHFPALKNLAVLYQKAGFRHKAIETWERALRVAPDDPTRQSIKEHLVGLL